MVSEIRKIQGGTIYNVLGATEPGGTFFVQCERHTDYHPKIQHNFFLFESSGFKVEEAILDAARNALALCPECVKESIIVVSPSCPQEEHDACGCAQ